MAVQLDHLMAGQRVRVLRAFRDGFGFWHEPDEEWRIVEIEFDVGSLIATLHVDDGTRARKVRLDLKQTSGPGLGRMREWFAVASDPPWPAPASPDPWKSVPEVLAPLHEALRQGDTEAAEACVRALVDAPEYSGEALQLLAEQVEDVARAVLPEQPAAGAWAYDRAIVLWHGWGSMATSGGDGAARMPKIKAAYRRRDALLGKR